MNLHHKGELIREELGTGADLGVSITYSHEEHILGTGGGIVKIADFLTDGGARDFFVVNGKMLVDADLHALRARHERTRASATMLLKEVPDAQKWGAIETDRDGRVLRIIGQGPTAAPAAHSAMFTGIHVLSPQLVARLPEAGESDSIRQAYLPALLEGERIEAVLHPGYFHEHSTPARYLQGNLNALYGRAQLRFAPGPLTGVDPTGAAPPHGEAPRARSHRRGRRHRCERGDRPGRGDRPERAHRRGRAARARGGLARGRGQCLPDRRHRHPPRDPERARSDDERSEIEARCDLGAWRRTASTRTGVRAGPARR